MSFSGKVILITGASSGIGAALAEYFAKHNALLALTGRNLENLQKTKTECMKYSMVEPLLIQADVTTDAVKIVKATIEAYGKLDVLINNAGVFQGGSIETTSMENYDYVMNTNVRAVYELTMLSVPYLIKTQGNIINVSSLAGIRSNPGALAYSLSKAAIDQFTKCIALELGAKKVRVNAINPSFTMTNIFKNSGMDDATVEEKKKSCEKTYPLGRYGTVDDIVEAVGFLACEAKSGFITGTCLPIDGGKNLVCPR